MITSPVLWSLEPNTLLGTIYAIIFLIILMVYLQKRRFLKLSRQFPGPLELPFIGVFHRMASPKDVLPCLRMVVELYDTPTVFTYFGPQPCLYTIDPKLLEPLFTSTELYNKPDILYDPLSNLFGDGLFSSHANKWHHHRKIINPAFRLPVLRSFLPVFNRNSVAFKSKLETLVGKGEIDLGHMLERMTLTAAMETMLGNDVEEGKQVDEKIVHDYGNVMKFTLSMVILNVFKLSGLAKHFNFYRSRDSVFKFVNELIRKRVAKRITNNNNKSNNNTDDDLYFNESRFIFIDQALKNYERNQFNWKDVLDESNSIIFAAFETTASATYTAILFLAMHPEAQDKLYDEIKSIYPDRDFIVNYEDFQNCVYLDMVVSETLRLAPSVPTIARGVTKDTQLTDDIMLPKDLVVLVNIFQVHRNVNIWGPDAYKFNPDNFLPENIRRIPKYGYIPFSKGIRNCIGGRYAVLAMKVFLLQVLRNYSFSTTAKYEDLEFINHVTLKYQTYPKLTVHKRNS